MIVNKWTTAKPVNSFVILLHTSRIITEKKAYVLCLACHDVNGDLVHRTGGNFRWSSHLEQYYFYLEPGAEVQQLRWESDDCLISAELTIEPWHSKAEPHGLLDGIAIGYGLEPATFHVSPIEAEASK